jgi:hypothetical protein
MLSPFPGMNPYLEDPFIWHEVHNRLIVALANQLGSQLRPHYYAAIETRTYLDDDAEGVLVGIPDAVLFAKQQAPAAETAVATLALPQPQLVQIPSAVEVTSRYLEVRQVKTHEVISVIEILSPKNKRGDGRESYLKKRQMIFSSQTHLIEIDLLRAYSPMPLLGVVALQEYRILVSDAQQRPNAALYGFGVRDRIPVVPLPLKGEDGAIALDLQPILHQVYDEGNFDLRLDYRQDPPKPNFSKDDQQWIATITAVSS